MFQMISKVRAIENSLSDALGTCTKSSLDIVYARQEEATRYVIVISNIFKLIRKHYVNFLTVQDVTKFSEKFRCKYELRCWQVEWAAIKQRLALLEAEFYSSKRARQFVIRLVAVFDSPIINIKCSFELQALGREAVSFTAYPLKS